MGIVVKLQAVGHDVKQIVFVINIYTLDKTFKDVRNAYCRVTDDSTQRELCRYRLIDSGNQNGLIVASINREPGDRWGFHAVGVPCRGRNHLESLEEIKQACEGIGQTEKDDTSVLVRNHLECSTRLKQACDEMNRMERTQCNGCKAVRPGSAPAASVVASTLERTLERSLQRTLQSYIQSETHTPTHTPKLYSERNAHSNAHSNQSYIQSETHTRTHTPKQT